MSDYIENGKKFSSYDAFVKCMKDMEKASGFFYSSTRSKTLKSVKRFIPNESQLKYHRKSFSCVCGGTYIPKGKGLRNKPSKKTGCPAGFIYVTPPHGKWAETIDVCLEHTCKDEVPVIEREEIKNSARDPEVSQSAQKISKASQLDATTNFDEFSAEIPCHSSMEEDYSKGAIKKQVRVNVRSAKWTEPTTFKEGSIMSTLQGDESDSSLENFSVKMDNVSDHLRSAIGEPIGPSTSSAKGAEAPTFEEPSAEKSDSSLRVSSTDIHNVSSDLKDLSLQEVNEAPFQSDRQRVIRTINQHNSGNFEVDEEIDVGSIKFSGPARSRGRPAGSTRTAIGLPRKTPRLMPYDKLSNYKKCQLLLGTLLDNNVLNLVLNTEFKVKVKDLPKDFGLFSDCFVDENVNVKLLTEYFEPGAFDYFKESIEKKKEGKYFTCPSCDECVEDGSIICDYCLLWYHFKCVGLSGNPRKKYWYCPECIKKY